MGLPHKIMIYLDASNPIEVNVETVNEDERLDEALDSARFSFISKEITTDIPPFTIATITPDTRYFYCSSQCDEIVEMPGYYYHNVQFIEAIKITETWVIGSKSFSVIKGKSSYNKGYDRLVILNELVKQQYGYTIILSDFLIGKLQSERALSYGAGTTYFDIALEICKIDNCLPIIDYISNDGKTIELSCIDIGDLETSNIDEFKIYSKVTKNQSVDEYCNDIVTEMDSIVDRDNLTTCVITPRSASEIIYKDNALLKLPTKCESVDSLFCWMKGKTGPTVKIPDSELNFSSTTDYNADVKTSSVKLYQWIDTYGGNDTIKDMLKTWISNMESWLGKESGYYDQGYIYYEKGNYCLLTLWSSSDYELNEGWINLGVLNKEQWSLLTTDEQPYFIYYENDSNTIDGFMNYKDNSFWNKAIFGEKGPFFKEIYKHGVDKNYRRQLIYTDFDRESIFVSQGGHSLRYRTKYHILRWNNATGSSYVIDYKFKVIYTAKPHLGASITKTIQPENESTWKKTTRSYNNGASTVDYNQLIPAMKRNVNMLGLETISIESLEDKPVGTRTQFGYIISKQTNYNIYNYEKVINNIVYNCCQNYQQIAQAIGVDTQWEATNVPSNEIITRYVTINRSVTDSIWNELIYDNNTAYIVIVGPDGDSKLSKACAKVCYDDVLYLICEAEDNYTFDYAKTYSNVVNYYKNNPIPYANSDLCKKEYKIMCYLDNGIYATDSPSNAAYDMLPEYVIGKPIISNQTVYVEKDPRERLIFQYRLTKY